VSKAFVHSFSAIELFELCGLKFQHEKILKTVPFVETEQVKWGNDCHKALEIAVKNRQPLESRYAMFQGVVDSITKIAGTIHTELKMGLNREYRATGFFDSDVYIRGVADVVIDCGARLFAGDYKSGRKKAGSKQLAMMALMLFAKFPDAQEIYTAFIWLQNRSISSEVYKREQIPELWELFLETMANIEWAIANNTFHASENFLCKNYCGVHSCLYNGRSR
jgi:hypothetical protein